MNFKTKLFGLCLILLFANRAVAQEETKELTDIEKLEKRTEKLEKALTVLNKLKISGYLQGQYQYGEKDASLKVGSSNENKDESFNRFGIRRGRLKFTYEEGIASGVFQLDITEKDVTLKDAYINVKDPWLKTNAIRAGVFDRPFGYEIAYSSSRRESPERSTVFQLLFPEERDLGAMLILQPSKTSPLNFLKIEAGLFAGNGIKQETDSRKDFIGHLSAVKSGNSISWGLGASYYNGGVHQGSEKVYKMNGSSFKLDQNTSNIGKYAKREYFGFDGQFAYLGSIGLTTLRAEYLFGQQPGTKTSTKSPNYSSLPVNDTYIRDFKGGYVMLVQDFGKSPFSAVLKYDWYDPNTKVSGDDIGLKNETGKSDLSQNTIGVGGLWRVTSNLRLQAYYEFNNYEETINVNGENDFEANVFTLRLQYKF